MNKKNVFLFPGQGSQYCGIGKNIFNFYNKSESYFEIANEILGYDIKKICFDAPKEELNKTKFTQPAIFINSVIKDDILKKNGIYPSAVAGHSLGEYSALVSAEILSYEDTLKIIKVRSEQMHIAGKKQPGGMAAIIGATNQQIKELCNHKETVVPANYNSETQIVISGSVKGIELAIKKAKIIGIKKAIKLDVSGAFHSPLMQYARKKIEIVIKKTNFKSSKIPIYQNIDPIPNLDSNTIKSNLIKQLENPVQWYKTILNMNKNNLNYFIEVGPGRVLCNLNKKNINNSVNKSFKDVINYINV